MEFFDYSKVKDPGYFRDKRLPAHSNHKYYESREHMEQGMESFRYSLKGLWKFHYAKNYQGNSNGWRIVKPFLKIAIKQ